MSRPLVTVLAVIIGFALGACGSEDDDSDPQAPAKCEQWKAAFCARVADCATGGERNAKIAQCRSEVSTVLNCAAAVGVSSTFDACMRETMEVACSVLAASSSGPASCKGAILVP